jgi:hypothetical protein
MNAPFVTAAFEKVVPSSVEYWYPDTLGTPSIEPVKDTSNVVSDPFMGVAINCDGAEPTRFVVAVVEMSENEFHEPFETALSLIEY